MISATRKIQLPLLFAFFFGSGFAALLYQIVWVKYLNLLFGSTTYATAAVLSAFFFGLSVGSKLSPSVAAAMRQPLRAYGLIEIGVGIFALFFPAIYAALHRPFSWIFRLFGPEHFLYNVIGFVVAFIVLAVPTALMGASLPVLSHYIAGEEKLTTRIGYLYAINTAGAVTGILMTAFILIPQLGLHSTISVGVIVNLVVGLICFIKGKERNGPFSFITGTERKKADLLLVLYALSGLVAIGYEVLWTRVLVLHLGSSVYAYAIMLSIFLIGISAGSAISGRFLADITQPSKTFAVIQIAWAFSILFQAWQFSQFQKVLYFFARLFSGFSSGNQFVIYFLSGCQALVIPTFLSGALFPLVVKHVWQSGSSVRDAVGITYAYNTIGGIIGSMFAGFILIPFIGTQNGLLALAFLNLLFGCLAGSIDLRAVKYYSGMIAAISVFVLLSIWISRSARILESAGIFEMEKEEKLVHLEEDSAATVSVEDRKDHSHIYRSLSVNGVNVAGTSPDLIAIQKLQAHIPMMLAGINAPRRVLHIGFGSGGTAYSVSLYPRADITVVELSHAVVRNADRYLRMVNNGIVHSGRLKFIFFDGRSYLQNTDENYDVILSDSIHPRYSGNGSLYTRDYYQLVWNHLRNGGVHSQWIPLYSLTSKNLLEILRAFVEIFPESYVWYINSTVNPFIIITGRKAAHGIPFESIAGGFRIQAIRRDLLQIRVRDPYFLLDYFLMGRNALKLLLQDAEPHMDDRMTVEYESSLVIDRAGSWRSNFQHLLQYREGVIPYLDAPSLFDVSRYQRFIKATTKNLEGQIQLLASRPDMASLLFRQARELNPEDTDPYVPDFTPE